MLLLGGVLLSILAPVPGARAEPPAPGTPAPAYVPGAIVIAWEPDADHVEKVAARAGAEVEFEAQLGAPAFQLVQVDAGQSTADAIEALAADPAVAVAERDSLMAPASTPNDPLFGQEWGLENTGAGVDGFSGATAGADIDALGAWSHTVGTPSTVVADIDTGYRFDSPDLGPVAWVNPGEIPGNGIDDDGNGYVDDVHGYDFVGPDSEAPSEDADPTDGNLISGGHGVHTAGTIGAAGNNGVGISGVAQNIRIMPLRVCANAPATDEARCPTSSIIAAINYAGANGARVANISLGGTGKSTAMLDAFAQNPKTLYVVAAGNDAQNNDSVKHYPCDYEPATAGVANAVENIVCVAATNQADQLASFSDWGAENVDLGAPGTEILSTYPAMETLFEEDFEAEDFGEKWNATGVNGGFERTNEAPLDSFGMSDSPGAAPVAESSRSSTLAHRIPVPAEAGSCQLSGKDSVSLGGGSFTLIVFRNGVSAFTFQIPSTSGSGMHPFITAPMSELDGAEVGIRFRYTAGSLPTESSGAWIDDLALTCYAPLSTPPGYAFLQGTSMATPHVSGAAALLFSLKPGATVEEVSDALLSSVDPDPSLAGKTTSGGRLDAAKALAYLEPPAPMLTATDPASPAEEANPRIIGSTAAGSRVLVFRDDQCRGSAVRIGTAAELASPGLEVHVPDESTAEFSAIVETRFNSSPCSKPIAYTNSTKAKDEVPPEPPVLSSTAPVSPASDTHPKLIGSAEAGSAVQIYTGPDCTGTLVAEGSAGELAAPGIGVSVEVESNNEFTATATDAALNVSSCSKPIFYTQVEEATPDEVPPAAPVLSGTDPASPASDWNPRVLGTAESESTVRIYEGTTCGGSLLGQGQAQRLGDFSIEVTIRAETTAELSATATDAAGNASPCSEPISYTNTATIGASTVIIEMPSEVQPAPVSCTVPKLTGKTLARAKSALAHAGCLLGGVRWLKAVGKKRGSAIVSRSSPPAGATAPGAVVRLVMGPKRKRTAHRH